MGKTLGQFVRDFRIKNDLTLSELGELCGMSGSTVSNIEAGNKVYGSTVEKLAKGMKVSLRQLLALPVMPQAKSNGVSPTQADPGAALLLDAYIKLAPEQRLKLLQTAMELAVGLDLLEAR